MFLSTRSNYCAATSMRGQLAVWSLKQLSCRSATATRHGWHIFNGDVGAKKSTRGQPRHRWFLCRSWSSSGVASVADPVDASATRTQTDAQISGTTQTTSAAATVAVEAGTVPIERNVYSGTADGLILKKGLGFIQPDQRFKSASGKTSLLFFLEHVADRRIPEKGDRVEFQVRENDRNQGEYLAFDIRGGSGREWLERETRSKWQQRREHPQRERQYDYARPGY
ncbi:unnamed protein product [Amoebophrya sp. A25]|nr:unnamed protein product [Amoebophrya sp. A25]|eukprot:GSA25T00001582001.1